MSYADPNFSRHPDPSRVPDEQPLSGPLMPQTMPESWAQEIAARRGIPVAQVREIYRIGFCDNVRAEPAPTAKQEQR